MTISSMLNASVGTPTTTTPSATSASSSSNALSGTIGSGSALTEQDFLTLLVTQLQNQNPAQPVSDNQLATEIASFTTANGVTEGDTLLQQIASQLTSLTSATQNMASGGTMAVSGGSPSASTSTMSA